MAKGQAQMVSTVGVQKAGRPTMGLTKGKKEGFMKHEVQTKKESFIRSFIGQIFTACSPGLGAVLSPSHMRMNESHR